tara:strand:+ start:528 stop:875 length:348 start_codon:yes stop_codon:yes gene_type:complete
MNNYEIVYILNPVLSEKQIEEVMKKIKTFLTSKKGKVVNYESWGLKTLSYPIENKNSGFYNLIEFTAETDTIADFEVELRRDERIMRHLVVKLEKDALEWAEKRRKRLKSKEKTK